MFLFPQVQLSLFCGCEVGHKKRLVVSIVFSAEIVFLLMQRCKKKEALTPICYRNQNGKQAKKKNHLINQDFSPFLQEVLNPLFKYWVWNVLCSWAASDPTTIPNQVVIVIVICCLQTEREKIKTPFRQDLFFLSASPSRICFFLPQKKVAKMKRLLYFFFYRPFAAAEKA